MTAKVKTNEQATLSAEKRSVRRKEQKPKRVIHLNGSLACQRCPITWTVSDLNPERKVVPCPVCGEVNDIREAIKRAA